MIAYRQQLQATLDGDKNAFAHVVQSFREMALTVAGKRLGRGLAEDAVQEAFFTAYLRLSDLKELDAFPAWLMRILRSCINKVLRQHQSHLSLSDLDESRLVPYVAPRAQENLLRFQTRAMVAKTLESLGGVMREACIQRYLHGLSYKQIAAVLNVPVGTIKRRLHDARNKIIREFQAEERPILRVGYLPVTDHLLAMVSHHAHDQGDYEIRLKKFLSWGSLTTSLENGLIDAAFIMAPLAMELHNKGLPIVYVLDAHHNGSAITVHKDVLTETVLSGGRIGLPYAISTQGMILANMFELASSAPSSKIAVSYLSPSYLIGSLVSHQIDAFFCAEPWNAKSVFEGFGRIYARSRDVYPGHMCCVLVVRKEFVVREGDVLRSYLRSLLSAGKYTAINPGRAAAIQARYTGVPVHIAEWVLKYSGVSFHDLVPDRARLECVMTLAFKTGIIDRPCDLDCFMHKASI
jgi:NitT/TauT family transport system substrate-binding protein